MFGQMKLCFFCDLLVGAEKIKSFSMDATIARKEKIPLAPMGDFAPCVFHKSDGTSLKALSSKS